MTYRYLSNSILTQISQNSDDSEITLTQVLFWIKVVANRLKKEVLKKEKTQLFLHVLEVSLKNQNGKKYIDVPEDIINLGDGSIDFVEYCASDCNVPINFSRTSASGRQALYGNPFTKPSYKNPYFYVTKDKVYFVGVNCIDFECLRIGAYLGVNSDPCSLDEEVGISADLVEILIFRVLSLARFALMTEEERINDGDSSVSNIAKISNHEQQQNS